VVARWRMGDGVTLRLACNLAEEMVNIEAFEGEVLFATSDRALESGRAGQLEAYTTIAQLISR
jgi:maltooligosyltrehalose trehalohydrolase